MTGAHFRWGAVTRLEPGSSRLRLLIYPPGTTGWQRRCASTAAVPVCGWVIAGSCLVAIVAGVSPGGALGVAFMIFVIAVIIAAVGSARTRRGSIELVALDPRHQLSEAHSRRLRVPSTLMAELVNADTAFREGRISRLAYESVWQDAYRRAVRLTRFRR